jgi:hypothetical protein
MAKYEVKLDSIESRLPGGWRMPASLRAFAAHCRTTQRGALGWFALKYSNPKHLMDVDVGAELVPFMVLPDGGFVGLWFQSKTSPIVVSLLSEGESDAVGANWEDFLQRLLRGKSRVEDVDDREGDPGDLSKLRRSTPSPKPLTAERKAFRAWLKAKAPKPEKLPRARSEALRVAIFGALKKYLKKSWDSGELVVDCSSRTYRAQWYAGGLQLFPDAEKLRAPLTELSQLLGRPLRRSKLTVWGDGNVIFEENTYIGKKIPIR